MSIQEVTQKLDELNDMHDQLWVLAEQKRQVLIDNNVDELSRIVNRESRLLKQVGEMEQQRIDFMGRFLQEIGHKPSPAMTVSELAKLVYKAEEKKRLLGAQGKLLNTIGKLREINSLNRQLTEQSLAFIEYSLDLVAGDPGQDAVYHNPAGQTYGNKRSGIFDTRA